MDCPLKDDAMSQTIRLAFVRLVLCAIWTRGIEGSAPGHRKVFFNQTPNDFASLRVEGWPAIRYGERKRNGIKLRHQNRRRSLQRLGLDAALQSLALPAPPPIEHSLLPIQQPITAINTPAKTSIT